MAAPIHAKVVIIGSGPAGYTAAIYAARAMLEPVLIQGIQPGGQLTITTDVENYPGFVDVIQGPWLMEQMEKQAAHVGTKIVTDHVNKLDLQQRPFRIATDSGDIYLADTVILATGAPGALARDSLGRKIQGLRRFGLRHLRRLLLSQQGSLRDRRRQHRGRGSAVPDQFRLERGRWCIAATACAPSAFAGSPVQASQDQGDLGQARSTTSAGSENPSKVTHVRLKNLKSGNVTEHTADGVFIAIGHAPATELVAGQLKLKPSGYVEIAPHSTATSVPGVFAAGDVADETYRQAVTAAGLGCMAALEAEIQPSSLTSATAPRSGGVDHAHEHAMD